MGAPAIKAVEPEAPVAPDISKPIRLRYWKSPHTLGTLTQTDVTVNGTIADGTTSGKVLSVWFFPAHGVAVAEIEVGWRPGQLASPEREVKRLVLGPGHGMEL